MQGSTRAALGGRLDRACLGAGVGGCIRLVGRAAELTLGFEPMIRVASFRAAFLFPKFMRPPGDFFMGGGFTDRAAPAFGGRFLGGRSGAKRRLRGCFDCHVFIL